MGIGFSVRIAPGVRVRASTRGVRASVGPRAARISVGSGRTRISGGIGPVTVSSTLGGGRAGTRTTSHATSPTRSRATSGTTSRTSLDQLNRQWQAAQREQEIAAAVAAEEALTRLHLEDFGPPQRPVADAAPDPTAGQLTARRRAAVRAATSGIGWFERSRRRAAASAARAAVDDLVRRERVAALVRRQRRQLDLDAEWAQLQAHDPDVVLATVDAAFADNASDSTCVDAGVDLITGLRYVTCVVLFGTPAMVPDRQPATTPTGRPTLKTRTKTERNAVYVRALGSTVLATVKEALAVAVGADEAVVLVLRRDPDAATPEDYLGALYVGRFRRSDLNRLTWAEVDPVEQLLLAPGARLVRRGVAKEVVPLDVGRDAELEELLAAFRATRPSD